MNALMIVAALAAGQCDPAVNTCTIEVRVEALVVAKPTPATRCEPACCRRVAPVRNTVKAVLKVQPVRRMLKGQPVRRLLRAKPVRTFLKERRPLRRLGRAVLGCRGF